MKKFGMMLAVSVIIFGFVSAEAAFAGKIGKRQVKQQKRIYQGVRSGELTFRETRALERGQYNVQKCKRKVSQDGKVTPKERNRLRRKQNHENRHIYKMKHNNITR